MTRSYTGQILQLAEIPEYVFSHPGERTEVAKTIRNALYELCYGLKGTAINAYESACSIEGGDKEWKETGTLEEMQTVVLLSELLNFLLNAEDSLNDAPLNMK